MELTVKDTIVLVVISTITPIQELSIKEPLEVYIELLFTGFPISRRFGKMRILSNQRSIKSNRKLLLMNK